MQPALSQQVKSAAEFKFRKSRRERARIELASTGDVAISIPTVPFADVGFAFGFDSVTPRERDEFACRALNVVVSAIALILLAPLIVLIAVAIKLTTPGPVVYSQIRVGVDRRWRFARSFDRRTHDFGGRLFRMFKFRTMYQNAESDGQAVWASKRDPRVTVIGRFLRGTRLDELPQLWNVLLGDMNIVGPRPERPTIFAELRRNIPEYSFRQRVKPGITGWAQVNLAYDACIDDVRQKVRYDLEYVRRQSVVEDIRIMSMTLPVMIFRRGAH